MRILRRENKIIRVYEPELAQNNLKDDKNENVSKTENL